MTSWSVHRCESCGRSVSVLAGAVAEVRCGRCGKPMPVVGDLPTAFYEIREPV